MLVLVVCARETSIMAKCLKISWWIGGRRVDVFLGRGILRFAGNPGHPLKCADRVCFVADKFSSTRCLAQVKKVFSCKTGKNFVYVVPEGEKAKSFDNLKRLHLFLLKNGFSRESALVAVGGGAVSDLTGFAAATYMRGIEWACVPTTLLSQVDAGIGGKTGINLDGTKNVAGVFYQPSLVICDTSFLDSLSKKQVISGIGEMVKYALVFDGKMYGEISENTDGILKLREPLISRLAAKCVRFKMDIVARDERDDKGLRELLNFGHTFGHAVEALSGGKLGHGEAVIWGMRAAVAVSAKMGELSPRATKGISCFLESLPAQPLPCPLRMSPLLGLLARDKKRGTSGNRFILLKSPGRPVIADGIPEGILRSAASEVFGVVAK